MRINKQETCSIAFILLSIYYLWYFVPCIKVTFNNQLYKYLFFGCFAIGLGILFINYLINENGRIKPRFNILVPIIVYMIVMTLFVIFNYYDASNHIRVSFTFWGTSFIYFLMSYNPAMRRSFGKFLILLLIINSITSFIGVYSDERAARALANASKAAEALEEDVMLSKKNISSIYLFQSLAVIAPIFVCMIKKKIKIIWSLFVLIFIIIAILKASFTICLLLLITGIILSLIYAKGWIGKILLPISIIIFLFLPWNAITYFFADIIDNSYISTRLYDISHFLSVGYVTGNMTGRATAYLSSVNTFIKHPFGIGAHYSYIANKNGIGYHSQIFDDLARYGLFSLVFYTSFLSHYYKLLKRQWSKINFDEVVFPIFIVYLGFLILNIAFRSSAESVMMLFILPVFPEIILEHKEKRKVPRLD